MMLMLVSLNSFRFVSLAQVSPKKQVICNVVHHAHFWHLDSCISKYLCVQKSAHVYSAASAAAARIKPFQLEI